MTRSTAGVESPRRESWSARHPQAIFALRLGALLALLLLVTESSIFSRLVREPLCSAIAWSAALLLGAFGQPCAHEGNTLTLHGFEVRVVQDCDGVFLVAVYLAAVLAFPAVRGWRGRLAAVPGLVFLVAANWIRVPVLTVVGGYRPEWFEFVHSTVFQWGLIVLLVAVWLRWAARERAAG